MDRKWMTGRMIGSEQLAPASSNVISSRGCASGGGCSAFP